MTLGLGLLMHKPISFILQLIYGQGSRFSESGSCNYLFMITDKPADFQFVEVIMDKSWWGTGFSCPVPT